MLLELTNSVAASFVATELHFNGRTKYTNGVAAVGPPLPSTATGCTLGAPTTRHGCRVLPVHPVRFMMAPACTSAQRGN